MSHVMTAPIARSAGRCCEECGYDLRGLADNSLCPECGHASAAAVGRTSELTAWSRAVFAGLVLLLWLTFACITSVLVQPSDDDFAGIAPAMNMPGPKLWAVPLLQRPIGPRAELPGVIGTRSALLSLFAIWLITTPCAAAAFAPLQSLRCATRYVSVIAFGLAFGVTLGIQGLWPGQLAPFRVLLVGGVELPATFLLYLYLRAIAHRVPGRERRVVFDRLAVAVPLIIAAGAVILIAQWSTGKTRNGEWILRVDAKKTVQLAVASAYGTIAAIGAIAAAGAVGSLAWALLGMAFPRTPRTLATGRDLLRRASGGLALVNWRAAAVAAGCVMMVFAMMIGNGNVLWTNTQRWGGILPFINFPGPKIWIISTINHSQLWQTQVGDWQLLTLNLAALWLMTTRPAAGSAANDALRRVVRWAPILFAGAATAMSGAIEFWLSGIDPEGRLSIAASAALRTGSELPATLLMYWMLARLAMEVELPALAKQFYALALVITVMFAASLIGTVMSLHVTPRQLAIPELLGAGLFGAVGLAAAAWATKCVLLVASAHLKRALQRKTAPKAGRLNAVHLQVG